MGYIHREKTIDEIIEEMDVLFKPKRDENEEKSARKWDEMTIEEKLDLLPF